MLEVVGEAILLEQSNTSLTLGGGYALVVHTMKGTAAGGYRSAEDRVTSGAPFGRADLRLRLVPALRVDLAALVGASLPELRVKFDDRTVARWGRPFVAVGLTFESAFVYF